MLLKAMQKYETFAALPNNWGGNHLTKFDKMLVSRLLAVRKPLQPENLGIQVGGMPLLSIHLLEYAAIMCAHSHFLTRKSISML